jgi:hypothetical protein
MAENYSFYYLNKEGALVTIVSMKCADDEMAMLRMTQFRPPSCASTEVWSGERRVLTANETDASPTIRRAKEHSPGH